MNPIKISTPRASAMSLAIFSMLLASNLNAGMIDNSNNTAGKLGACGVEGEPTSCYGAWNLDNVDVRQTRAADGTISDSFNKLTGAYTAMTAGDSFMSMVKNAAGEMMARLTGKVWPVGEPTGIKAVNGDVDVKNGKPKNCLINTSYLGEDPTVVGDVDQYLDDTPANPVICSSFFQSHKRFKIAMLPKSVEGVVPTVGGTNEGKPIDLVFNVTDNGSLTPYQVFSKINNYTDMRLKGYKIVVGRGVGDSFVPAGVDGIADKLHISLGIGEGWSSGSGAAPDGSNLFNADDGLATFSHGLFGAIELPHFPTNGFFDTSTAGFSVTQGCSAGGTCGTYTDPLVSPNLLTASDTIYSTGVLPSNYTALFGDWLPSKWQPKGIFFDFDSDPTTDADLVAWWDGTNWRKSNDLSSAIVSDIDFNAWKADSRYAIDDIEDVLNLGINYIVKVGDGIGPNVTIRIIPVVADTQVAPSFVGTTPTPLTVTNTASGGGGGGCTSADGEVPFDPVLPLIAAAGLLALGLRRQRRG